MGWGVVMLASRAVGRCCPLDYLHVRVRVQRQAAQQLRQWSGGTVSHGGGITPTALLGTSAAGLPFLPKVAGGAADACAGEVVSTKTPINFTFQAGIQKDTGEKKSFSLTASDRPIPPLPYRIAKALDPFVYRNVELDIIHEEKREIKLKLQGRGLYGVFCPGDKCQVHVEEGDVLSVYHAHVQEINEPSGPVVVYVEELGEKKTVPYSCLRPLPLTLPKTGSDLQNLLVAEIGPVAFGDRRGRRRKNILQNIMPGAAEFQTPTHMGRTSRTPVSRQMPEIGPKVAATISSTHQSVTDCISLGDGMEMTAAPGYCMVATSALPVSTPSHMTTQVSSPMIGQPTASGVVYWMPVVTVPYANTMGQVNLASAPSQDPYGKDLPHNDINTLRYFFNLGVEYFRISASMQQQQSFAPASPLQQPMANGSSLSMMLPLDQGQSFVPPEPLKPHNTKTNSGLNRTQPSAKASVSSPSKDSGKQKSSADEEVEKGENMELCSDFSEARCRSSGEEGSVEEDPEQQMEVGSNRTDDDTGSTQGDGEGGTEKGGKGKGKRKYYMYGSHKLIKPIKDIPPRFQMMLAENSAAKARCEGQPIYMQLSVSELVSYEQADGTSDLNADAQCFYPTQLYDAVAVDETGQCTYTNGSVTFTAPVSQPPPLLVPPPPVMQSAGGTSPVGLVYTSTPSTIASVMAPSLHTHPVTVSSTVPRLSDGKIVSVSSSTNTNAVSGPIHSNAGSEKVHEEFAQTSLVCSRSHNKPESSASPHISTCSMPVSVSTPASMLRAPPFSATTNLLPPLAPPSVHVGPTPPVSCTHGGGKQCFYLYPSPSAGFPAVPATPQGQSHMPGPSQGQVVYVMNPQAYPAPPCTAFQPTMMPPSAHSVGLPCPTVAVQ
ncbi:uncharacterized protein LOC112559407 isoform X3 [Pomacea canaliculata]|uniref:uncharacterized protein LOC112559407 isoform X3 n=1 Tax=Pomacea canaliculata TaxID=400727 RepID=UPI000D72F5C2|nr:uncharacterized protein LOC112559407 isoform X3 [Pomacea canaliculata]